MNKLLTLLLLSLISFALAEDSPKEAETKRVEVSETVNSSFTVVEKKVRNAAVKVGKFNGGHGSGSIIDYKGMHLVITAQHVTNDGLGALYYVENNRESLLGVLIYSDPINDIALLYLPTKFETVIPMKWAPLENVLEIGEQVYYSAHPSSHKLLSFRGRAAGYETIRGRGTQIILHTYGWFGCSGSVVYDSKGNIVGVLWGIDMEHYPGTQAVEDIVWVSPIRNLNMKEALAMICGAGVDETKACR
jgi:S1-C subfamily serine protease